MKDRVPRIDEGSSYHDRRSSIAAFVVIILLAIAAFFFEPDYMGHVPVRVGVSAFDSSRCSAVLDEFASLVRERDGGNVSWHYFSGDSQPEGCDFYLLTSLQYMAFSSGGGMELSLLATHRGGNYYSRGVVLVRKDSTEDDLKTGKYIFPFPGAASGYLSAAGALLENGLLDGVLRDRVCFAGCRQCDEEVIYGIIFGEYVGGGLTLDSYRNLLARGKGGEGVLEVRYTGRQAVDLVLATGNGVDQWKKKGFLSRLPVITARADGLLAHDLHRIGIGGFVEFAEHSHTIPGDFPDSLLNEIIYYLP
ncbi:MAG: phosphate/phosphite/phosphonate ABC transporter substrate-binding protein [Bacteroidales bacterium]|nr:phosphate/phosphite/phosphonate ABC transporter substrate-binding protein [Candidatus Latescibacterota bacterium]